MKASKKNSLEKPRFQPAVAVAVIAAVVVLGYIAVRTFAASGSAQLYLSPASATYTNGQAIAIAVYVNTGGDPVNAVQSDFSYPTAKLQYVSIDGTGSAFDIDASSTGGNGTVSIARGHAGNVSGIALVATVHFTVIASGSANLNFLNSSAVVRSTDNANILTSTVGGNYTLNAVSAPTPTPVTQTPAPAPGGGGTAKTPTPAAAASTAPTAGAAPGSTPVAAGATPTPANATPTPAVANAPASTAVPFVNKTKPLFGSINVLGIVAIGVPVLALLGLLALFMTRLRGGATSGAGGHGSDQSFVPPAAQPTAPPSPEPSSPVSQGKTFLPDAEKAGNNAPASSDSEGSGDTPGSA